MVKNSAPRKNESFLKPPDDCDLIMQGGITSGVVYPGAVLKLAPRFRFRSIGGTSAGAIAAAATAAAELGRQRGGFDRLATLPDELGQRLLSLFQPTWPFRGVFALFLACLGQKSIGRKTPLIAWRILACFPLALLIGISPTLLYCVRTWQPHRSTLEWIGILAASFAGFIIAWLARLASLALYHLPRALFGVCPGTAAPGKPPALTDWLTDLFDHLACFDLVQPKAPPGPLTFGHLAEAEIELKMMTTNLSSGRPYTLPFVTRLDKPEHDGRYAFKEKEWRQYFPERVMIWLHDHSDAVGDNPGYRYLPNAADLPVIVAVRLSLSFPGLLSAIPLYRKDYTYLHKPDYEQLRRCVFSDGGISSNFPIQFFDNLLPTRPTFAIALDVYSPSRCTSDDPQARVTMPEAAGKGFLLPIASIESLPAFLGAIVDTARNWQDNLQRILPGYRERVADVALTADEGGLNLTMPPTLIQDLNTLGSIAGDHMLKFDLEEHQWRRFLVAYARLEETFERMNLSYNAGFKTFLDTYPPLHTKSYHASPAWFDAVHDRIKALVTLTGPWSAQPLRPTGKIPKPDTDLRITSKP